MRKLKPYLFVKWNISTKTWLVLYRSRAGGAHLRYPLFETTIFFMEFFHRCSVWLCRTCASGFCRLNLIRAVGLVTSALHLTIASIYLCCTHNRPSHGHSLSLYLFQPSYGCTFLASGVCRIRQEHINLVCCHHLKSLP
jgi:hypothetical protein